MLFSYPCRFHTLPFACVHACLVAILYCITGQLIIDKLQQWRIKKAILLQYPELAELEWLVLDVEEQETVKQVRGC